MNVDPVTLSPGLGQARDQPNAHASVHHGEGRLAAERAQGGMPFAGEACEG
jgi:hypothetical protein